MLHECSSLWCVAAQAVGGSGAKEVSEQRKREAAAE